MRPVALLRWGGAAMLVTVALLLLAQLSSRADRSVQAAVGMMTERENAAVIRTASSVTIQFDQLRHSDSLMRGWSDPEPGAGVWSDGHEAVLKLPTPMVGGNLDVAIKAQPFLAAGLPAQRVKVSVGGTEVTTWRLRTGESQTLHAAIPRTARTDLAEIELQLGLPDADTPARLSPGSTDARLLAIMVRRIDVAAVQ
jgi:hypothetical protein